MNTTITFSIDPDEMDSLIAHELRKCYEALAEATGKFDQREATLDALLVVLDHYMAPDDYAAWYETIKEL